MSVTQHPSNAKLVLVPQVRYLEPISLEFSPHDQAQSRDVAQEKDGVNNAQDQHLEG